MRQFFHQIHLWLSIPLGILISVICLTGAILVFEKEITQMMYPETQTTQAEGQHGKKQRPPSAGKTVVGITTVAMIVILISGMIIWFPRNRRTLKHRLQVSCTKGWRRFWYDSHVALGFYSTLLLLIMALTGLTWSFPGYRAFMYDLFAGLPIENLRRFFYSLHTGTWGGLPTQILYFLASLTGGILPLSGYYLWWKKRKRK